VYARSDAFCVLRTGRRYGYRCRQTSGNLAREAGARYHRQIRTSKLLPRNLVQQATSTRSKPLSRPANPLVGFVKGRCLLRDSREGVAGHDDDDLRGTGNRGV